MVRLCIANALFFEGVDFSEHPRVGRILQTPGFFPVVLYPGSQSLNLSTFSRDERVGLVPIGQKMIVFVIDGTWKTARKIIRLSRNLQSLPFICFDPPRPSNYRIRQQPQPNYYSTIEAIHHVIDLLAPPGEQSKPHDNLLEIFDFAVNRQLRYSPK
jgi:DTW domain-containing protein YfiP